MSPCSSDICTSFVNLFKRNKLLTLARDFPIAFATSICVNLNSSSNLFNAIASIEIISLLNG
jgi:hypothetical protein